MRHCEACGLMNWPELYLCDDCGWTLSEPEFICLSDYKHNNYRELLHLVDDEQN